MAEATEKIIENEKPYTFRMLSSGDVFLMFKIISKIGINEFMDCFDKDGVMSVIKNMTAEEKDSESGAMLAAASVLLEVANVVMGNMHKCEADIYQLLANTSNLTVKEITAEGNGVLFVEMVVDFIKKPEFPDFFTVVSRLFK